MRQSVSDNGSKHAQAENPGAALRFETLDSWRGICALLVAVMHFPASGPIAESPFVRSAYLFVDYFFVLSGFVIAHGYGRKLASGMDYARFVVTRTGRIYPLHVAVLLAFLAFELLRWAVPALAGGAPVFGPGFTLPEFFRSLAMLNGLGVEQGLTWNGPSWSISSEFWTYLLFGAVVLLMGRRHWILLLLPVIAGPAFLLFWSPHYMDATWDYGFVRCLYGFSLGALVNLACGKQLAAARSRPASAAVWTLVEIIAVAAVFLFVSAAGKGPWSIAAPFLFAVALLVFARDAGLLSRALRTPILLWLGSLSYGIYMVHIFVQARMINAASLLEKATGVAVTGQFTIAGETFHGFGVMGPAFGMLMTGVMVVAVTATAWLGYVLIEKPFQRWSKQLASRIGATREAKPAPSKPLGTANGLVRARRT